MSTLTNKIISFCHGDWAFKHGNTLHQTLESVLSSKTCDLFVLMQQN